MGPYVRPELKRFFRFSMKSCALFLEEQNDCHDWMNPVLSSCNYRKDRSGVNYYKKLPLFKELSPRSYKYEIT